MAKLLSGKEVAGALSDRLKRRCEGLKERGIVPTLAIVRLGEDPGDKSYEKGAMTRAEAIGVLVKNYILPEMTSAEELIALLRELNRDGAVHGVLLFRPLPKHLRAREREICNILVPEKDMDGMTELSAAGVYTGSGLGYPPCTAAACMEILDHYGISCEGKSAVVVGRSLVVGKPAAMMLLRRNATVTLCHTKTLDTAKICREADIILTAAGQKKSLSANAVRPGQVIVDVSMNYDPNKVTPKGRGGMVGDCDFDAVEPIVAAITPVPGGVGAVTSTVLMKHVIEAAEQNR